MRIDNLCTHQITMRVWRQSSETRQAVLDEERQDFLENSFENMLKSKRNQSSDSPEIGAGRDHFVIPVASQKHSG